MGGGPARSAEPAAGRRQDRRGQFDRLAHIEVNVDQMIGKRKSTASVIATAYNAIRPTRRRIWLAEL